MTKTKIGGTIPSTSGLKGRLRQARTSGIDVSHGVPIPYLTYLIVLTTLSTMIRRRQQLIAERDRSASLVQPIGTRLSQADSTRTCISQRQSSQLAYHTVFRTTDVSINAPRNG